MVSDLPSGLPTWAVILVCVAPVITSLATAIGTLMNRKSIQAVHLLINSRMTELLKASIGEATTAGKADGLKEGHAAGVVEGRLQGK